MIGGLEDWKVRWIGKNNTLCHPRMGHPPSLSPSGGGEGGGNHVPLSCPKFSVGHPRITVMPEWVTICHPRML
jgi:hypothetical protein